MDKHHKIRSEIMEVVKIDDPSILQKIDKELDIMEVTEGINDVNNLENFYSIWKDSKGNKGTKNEINSWVAWAIGLTDKKPEKDSSFMVDRRIFARAGFPDIDMDFDYFHRDEIYDYIVSKYGREFVGNIGTYQGVKLKSAVTRIGKVLDVAGSFHKGKEDYVSDNEAKIREIIDSSLPKGGMVKTKNEEGNTIVVKSVKQAYQYFPNFKFYMDKYPELFVHCNEIEGIRSVFGCHAAGIVVSDVPLENIAPMRRAKENSLATQYDMEDLESIGLIKIDILALSTLTVIAQTVKMIEENYGIKIDVENIPLDDEKTYELYRKGNLTGVFQCEQNGMQHTIRDVGVDKFDDIMATIALYRPGPMAAIPDYCMRKRGEAHVDYFHPTIEPYVKQYLERTYGVLCVHGDTKVSLYNGLEKKISEIDKEDIVLSLNSDNKFEPQKCHKAIKTKFGDGIEIELSNGFSVVLTSDHKVLTVDGWIEAGKLEIDDLVTFANYLPHKNIGSDLCCWLGDNFKVAYMLGQLTGDGSNGTAVTICSGTKKNTLKLEKWININLPKLRTHMYYHGRSFYIRVSCSELLSRNTFHGNRKTKWHKFIEDCELKRTCYHKKVPDIILKSNLEIQKAYLAGLIDSDGYIGVNKNGYCVANICSVSDDIIHGVRRILQNLKIEFGYNNNHIYIYNTNKLKSDVEKYLVLKDFKDWVFLDAKNVGFVKRSDIVNRWKQSGLSSREFSKTNDISRSILTRNFNNFCDSNTSVKVGVDLGDIKYYKIKSINKVYNQQFYDISVDNLHNFVGNGFILHNCYQEQVMQICNSLANLSILDGYILIKGIGKKKQHLIDKFKKQFIKGCFENGVPKNIAEIYWDKFITPFAAYGFNAAHCLAGDMRLKDKQSGKFYSVEELYNIFYQNDEIIDNIPNIKLDSYVNGELVEDELVDIFCTGEKDVYEITLDNGIVLKCTLEHKFYCSDGIEHTVKDILENDLEIIFEGKDEKQQ